MLNQIEGTEMASNQSRDENESKPALARPFLSRDGRQDGKFVFARVFDRRILPAIVRRPTSRAARM